MNPIRYQKTGHSGSFLDIQNICFSDVRILFVTAACNYTSQWFLLIDVDFTNLLGKPELFFIHSSISVIINHC